MLLSVSVRSFNLFTGILQFSPLRNREELWNRNCKSTGGLSCKSTGKEICGHKKKTTNSDEPETLPEACKLRLSRT